MESSKRRSIFLSLIFLLKYKEDIKLIIGKEGNQNSGVEYGNIRPGLISRRVK